MSYPHDVHIQPSGTGQTTTTSAVPVPDIISFLQDRIDEDVATAQALIDGDTTSMGALLQIFTPDSQALRALGERLLLEARAKERILAEYRLVEPYDTLDPMPEYAFGFAEALGFAVRSLVNVYMDHPAYNKAWSR